MLTCEGGCGGVLVPGVNPLTANFLNHLFSRSLERQSESSTKFPFQWQAMDITVRSKWILHNKAPFTTLLLPLCPHTLRKLVKVRRTTPLLSWDLWDPTFEAKLVIYRIQRAKDSWTIHQISNLLDSIIRSAVALNSPHHLCWWQMWPSSSASSRFIGTFLEPTVASKTARYKSNSTCRLKKTLRSSFTPSHPEKNNQSGKSAEFQAIWPASTSVILFCV